MAKSRSQKDATIGALTTAFKNAQSVMFADYQGLKVPQADALRKAASASKVTYIVAKKSLITLAAKQAGVEVDAKKFPGMIGAAFGMEDVIAPAKVLGDVSKTTSLKLVGGIFEGAAIDANKAIALSKLPSKHELLGMLVGTINAPVSAFVRALDAVRKQKEAGSPAPAPVAAPVAEAAPAPAPEAPVAEAPAETPVAPEAPAAA